MSVLNALLGISVNLHLSMLSSCKFDSIVDKFDENDDVKELACRISSQVIDSDVTPLELILLLLLLLPEDSDALINGSTCCPLELSVRSLQLTSEDGEREDDGDSDDDDEEEEEDANDGDDDNDGVDSGVFN